MAFRAPKVSGAFEKQGPGPLLAGNMVFDCHSCWVLQLHSETTSFTFVTRTALVSLDWNGRSKCVQISLSILTLKVASPLLQTCQIANIVQDWVGQAYFPQDSFPCFSQMLPVYTNLQAYSSAKSSSSSVSVSSSPPLINSIRFWLPCFKLADNLEKKPWI